MDLIEHFWKTRECPKCTTSYFSLEVNWMSTYVKTAYICEGCKWSFITMSSCTSPSSAPAPSSPDRSVASVLPTQSR